MRALVSYAMCSNYDGPLTSTAPTTTGLREIPDTDQTGVTAALMQA